MDEEEECSDLEKIKRNLADNGTFKVNEKVVQYSKKSLFLFDESNKARKLAVSIIEWKWFDRFIILSIFANSVCLGLYDYADRDQTTKHNKILNVIGVAFTLLFLLEAALKIFAMGFIFHKYSYMRDGWNVIDFIIVVTGVVDLASAGVNLKALRIVRVMRPLRSINAIPRMRMLVNTLLQSLPELGNATIFLGFVVVIFSIFGLQQFNGVLYNRCRTEPPINGTYWPKSDEYVRVCSKANDGNFLCPDHLYCGNPLEYRISLGDDGVYDDPQIQYGILGFDNFGQAVLSVFHLIARNRWTTMMYNLSDGYTSLFAKIYCCTVVIFGHYFLLKVILAIIVTNFSKTSEQEAWNEIIEAEKQLALLEAIEQKKKKKKREQQYNKSQEILKEERSPIKRISHQAAKSIALVQQQNRTPLGTIKENEQEQPEDVEQDTASPFRQLMKLRQRNQGLQKVVPHDEFGDLQQSGPKKIEQDSPSTNQNRGSELGFALFAKAFNSSPNDSYDIQDFQNQLNRTQSIRDLNHKIKVQNRIHDEQDRRLMKLNLQINKRLLMNKKNVYGIENETQILNQIQRSLQKILTENEQKLMLKSQQTNVTDCEEIENELDEKTLIALRITSDLKELTMKYQIKELLFNKFKQQLIKKRMFERMFHRLETQMFEGLQDLRAQKCLYYKVTLYIVRSYIFNIMILFSIIGNAIVLSLEKYPMDEDVDTILDQINLGFFSFFAFELVMKLSAYGFKYYFKDKFNWFDTAVVLVSSIDEILYYSSINNKTDSGAISALRIFRLIRIFQLAKFWKEFQDLLTVMVKTIKDISTISILLLLFIILYSLLGMELFAYKVKIDGDYKVNLATGTYPQSTFNTFIEAFISVFIVLTNGWTTMFFDHYRATDPTSAILYFVTLLIIGQYILLNLFLSLVIKNFEAMSVQQESVKDPRKKTRKRQLLNRLYLAICRRSDKSDLEYQDAKMLEEIEKERDEVKRKRPSLFIFSFDNKLRRFFRRIISNWKFEYLMIVFIIANSVQLAMDSPLNDPNSNTSKAIRVIDTLITAVFAIEAVMKIIVWGFVFCGSTSYMKNGWNIIDLIIVILSLIYLSMNSPENFEIIQILRLAKVLKTIQVIQKNESLRISIRTLGNALPGILKVITISLIFFLIFGIIGINFLKGRLYKCETLHLEIDKDISIEHKWDCLSLGGEWQNYYQSFDSIFEAIAALFISQALDNWQGLMYRGVSAVDIDYNSKPLSNPWIALYFIAFIVVGNFFLSNLYIGVLISTYNREKEAVMGNNFMHTVSQKKGNKNKIRLLYNKPKLKMKVPKSDWRQPFYYIAEHKLFDRFIFICILVNTVVLAITWYGQPPKIQKVTDTINYVFAGVFTLEIVIKIIAYGRRYFRDRWNDFDLIIVVLNLISIILTLETAVSIGPSTTIIRAFRIGRIFKLFRKTKSLKDIFEAFIFALPAMANVGVLLLLLIFIYAILGMYLFAEVKFVGVINDHANFQYIGTAFLTLIRITTGDTWTMLLRDYQREYSHTYQCKYYPTYQDYVANGKKTIGCGSYYIAMIYFFSYILLVQMIYLKLFTAILIQGFKKKAEKENKVLNQAIDEKFRTAWSFYDPDATNFIRVTHLPNFLMDLGEPLGWDMSYEYNFLKQQEYLRHVKLPIYNHNRHYQFLDVFEHQALLMVVKREVNEFMLKQEEQKLMKLYKDQSIVSESGSDRNKEENSSIIQSSLDFDRELLKLNTSNNRDMSSHSNEGLHLQLEQKFETNPDPNGLKNLKFMTELPGSESTAVANHIVTEFMESNKPEQQIRRESEEIDLIDEYLRILMEDQSLMENLFKENDPEEAKQNELDGVIADIANEPGRY